MVKGVLTFNPTTTFTLINVILEAVNPLPANVENMVSSE
jgi:hypothetical protein